MCMDGLAALFVYSPLILRVNWLFFVVCLVGICFSLGKVNMNAET